MTCVVSERKGDIEDTWWCNEEVSKAMCRNNATNKNMYESEKSKAKKAVLQAISGKVVE